MKRSAVFLALLGTLTAGLAHAEQTPPTEAAPAAEAAVVAPVAGSASPGPVADQLIITDTKVGAGKEAVAGNTVKMHYTGWLYRPLAKGFKGKKFDSSAGRDALEFPLGAGRVIKGWDQGIVGMKVGGKRTLIIPSELAYGSRAAPGGEIPPNSALIFDVEMVDVK